MDEKRKRRSSVRFLVLVVTALVAGVIALGYVATRPSDSSDEVRVVMTPVPGTSSTDLEQKLKDAASVLRLRLAAIDKRAQVSIDEGTLVVTAPKSLADQLSRLSSPGQLEMRPVLAQTGTSGCQVVPSIDLGDLEKPTAACSPDGSTIYSLGPARLTGSSVSGAEATDVGSNRQVVIRLTDLGRKQFTQLTRELSTKTAPTNELAIVIDGVVQSAPEVQAVIIGDTQISGEFTLEQAQALAVTIRYGGLPVAFVISGG